MQRNTKCAECGRLFDLAVVRAVFNERYMRTRSGRSEL